MSVPVPALPLTRRSDRRRTPSALSSPPTVLRLLALGALGITWAMPAASSAQQRTVLKNQERPLTDVPYGPETIAAVVSPDGSRAVVVTRAGQKGNEVTVQDGHPAGTYLALAKGSPILSADGKHCAYAGPRESLLLGESVWYVVYDGAEQGPFFFIQPESLAFGPDGLFLACVVRRRDGKEAVCVLSQDPPPQAAAGAGGAVAPAPPTNQPRQAGAPGQAAPAPPAPPPVIHQEVGRWYDRVGDRAPRFSPDGSYLTYAAFHDSKWHVLVNGMEGGAYDSVTPTRFCGSSAVMAYVGRREGKAVAVRVSLEGPLGKFGVEGPAQDEIRDNSLTFSYDGKHLAYVIGKPRSQRVISDGKEVQATRLPNAAGGQPPGTIPAAGPPSQQFDEVAEDSLVYSPDGKHLSFAACRGGQWFVVSDGIEGPAYVGLGGGPPVYSLDGRRLAYVAERVVPPSGGTPEHLERFVVIDGVAQKPYDRIHSPPVFSADGKRCAYVAERGGQFFAVIDGMEGKPYDFIRGRPELSPDGSRCAFTALPQDSAARFSAAEEVQRDPTDPSAGARLLFDRTPAFRALPDYVKKEPVKLLLVEERVVEE